MEDSWEWLQAGHLSAARPEAQQQESARALGRDCPLLQGTESGGAQGDWKVEIITLYISMGYRTSLGLKGPMTTEWSSSHSQQSQSSKSGDML